MRAGFRLAMCVIVACALMTTTVAVPAAEAQAAYPDDRADFGGVNGTAATVRAVGDQLWVGGEFTQALDADLTTTYPRANLAVLDFNTGDVRPIAPNPNEKVKAIESDDASLIWVGGNFTQIANQQISFIAAFDAYTGELDPTFSVTVDYPVTSLHYNDGWLYIGGEFGQINGLYYNKLARVDAVTGAVDTSFRANPNGIVRSIDTWGDRVYAGGLFEEVGKPPDNYPRTWVAGFDVDTGQPAGPTFPLLPLRPGEASHKAGVWRIHVSPDGNHVYTADQRNFIIQWNRLTGQAIWQREAEGDIQAVVTEADTIYVGTHDGFLAKNDQRLLFALNSNGTNDNSFLPLQDSFIGTLELTLAQGALVAVGDFTTIKGQPSPRVAVFHGPTWNGATPLVSNVVPGDVSCDDRLSVQDAIWIAQFSVGLRTQAESCDGVDPTSEIGPGADVNGDGRISVADAILIAQCGAGLPNLLCPE